MEIPSPVVTRDRSSCLWLVLVFLLVLSGCLAFAAGPTTTASAASAVSAANPIELNGPGTRAAGPLPDAATHVGGPIVTSTIWTLAGSPYIVDDDVVIHQSAVLTIEAGVTVSFTAGTGLRAGDGSPGRLVAEGTAARPITFTALGARSRGAWLGLAFSTGSPGNLLRYCRVEYAVTGLTCGDSDHNVVDHCVFRYNGPGNRAAGQDSPPPIAAAEVYTGGALQLGGDVLEITFNEIYSNELGLLLRKSNWDLITANLIYANDGPGISFVEEVGNGGDDNIIAFNEIHHNGENGLSLDHGLNNRVDSNRIYANAGYGIWSRRQAELWIIGNVVRGNLAGGWTLSNPGYHDEQAHGNAFCGNDPYNLDNLTDGFLNAQYNWFGTNEPGLDGRIHGGVYVTPWIEMAAAARPASLPADGVSTAALTVTLREAPYAVPDGYTVTVAVSAGSVAPPILTFLDGQATATYTAGEEPGPVLIEVSDGCATLAFTEALTLTEVPVDLAVWKTAGGLRVDPLKEYSLDYAITVTNAGTITATGVVITDTLPPQAVYAGDAWTCDPDGRVCSLAAGDLSPSATLQVSLPVELDEAALACPIVLTNTVQVGDDVPGGDAHPADNTFTLTSTFDCLPDLYVVVNDNVGPVPPRMAWAYAQLGVSPEDPNPRLCVSPGEPISYSIAYGNAGLVTATNVVLTEALPAGTSYVGGGWACAAGVCTRAVGTLAPGAGGIVRFIVQVDSAPPDLSIEDEVSIGGDEEDAYPPDNVSYDATPVCDVCLQLAKDDNASCAFPGDEIRYTVSVTNVCDSPAAGLVLTETVPAYTAYLDSPGWQSQGGGAYGYAVGTLDPGESARVVFSVLVNDPLPITVTETVNVVCAGRTGGAAAPCYRLATPLPVEADLRVVTHDHVGPPPPAGLRDQLDRFSQVLYGHADEEMHRPWAWDPVGPGDVYSYTITYLNLGRLPATGVVVTATLPTHTSYAGGGWLQHDSGTYTIPVGTLDVGQGGQRNFWVQVDEDACATGGYLYHWATIGGDPAECNVDNNWSGEETPVEAPICTANSVYLPLVLKGYPPPPPPPHDGTRLSDVAVNPVTNRVFVASPWLDAVIAIDPDAAQPIVASIPVGMDPWGLAVITTTNKIYAANIGSHNVTPIRGAGYLPGPAITVGVQPCKMAADSQDERAYVSHHLEPDNGAGAIDAATDTLEDYLYVKAQAPYGIDVDRVGEKLFVATRDAGLIAILDTYRSDPVQDPIWVHPPISMTLFLAAFNPTTQHLFVTAPYDHEVIVLDPYAIEWNKGRWATIDGRRAFVLDRSNAAWVAEVPVGAGAEEGIAVNPATNRVYVTNAYDDSVTVIQDDAAHAGIKPIATIDVGAYPQGVDVDPTRNRVYVGNAGECSLSVIDGAHNTVVKTIPLHCGSRGR